MILIAKRYVTPHFQYSELACPCCNILKLSDLFYSHMRKLEYLRVLCNRPLTINSGYRCAKHNKEVGGVNESMHLRFATDVRFTSGKNDIDLLHKYSVDAGFTGIGRYDTFIHLDCRPTIARWDNRKVTV